MNRAELGEEKDGCAVLLCFHFAWQATNTHVLVGTWEVPNTFFQVFHKGQSPLFSINFQVRNPPHS